MAKVTYASLKLKQKTSTNVFEFQGQNIEVLEYLPIEDKNDLISISLQKAEENGIYNPVLLDMYFHLNLAYLYTNITFTEKQKENEPKLYDALKANGFFDLLLENISEEEYSELYYYLEIMKEDFTTYGNSFAGVAKAWIYDLPKNAQTAEDIIKNFDKNKFQSVIDFATAANGGVPVV